MSTAFDREFERRYARLNAAQKQAVDTIDGPVMVIAGPGTGKTTILTLRIANILRRTDTPPDAILALTFTESGARAMRKKLAELVGPAAYRIRLHTFHSFANDIIKAYPDRFPRIIGAEHVEGIEQIALVERLIDEGDVVGQPFDILRPKGDPAYYVSKVISAIKDLKRDDISPSKFAELVAKEEQTVMKAPDLRHEKGKYAGRIKGEYQDRLDDVAKNKELVRAYEAYEKALARDHLYDFEDMIIETVKTIAADRDLSLRIQEEYQYVLADEHQDANTAQNELLELVSSFHDDPNLFIVGDEKQAIFRFQGASLENFLYFKRRFPKATLIRLTENYRSHQTILDAAHAIIGNNAVSDESLRVELKAMGGAAPRSIDCVGLPDRESELAYVAAEAKKLVDGGVPAREIAVLVRNNRHAEAVERALAAAGVPVARFADADVLDHPYAEALFAVVRASLRPADDELVAKALFAPFLKLDLIEVAKAIALWRKEKGALIDSLAKGRGADGVRAAHPDIKRFSALLTRFARLSTGDPAIEAFETIARESGFIEFVVGHARARELVPLYSALLSTVTRFAERDRKATLYDFMEKLDHARERGYNIAASYVPPDGVELMTAHGSKGLEFEYVFILHAEDGIWGGNRSHRAFKLPGTSENDSSEDERRLFYVALTRAKKHAVITYAEHAADGRDISPSRFILEIPEAHASRTIRPSAAKDMSDHIAKRGASVPFLKDIAYLRTLFIERGFPVTHLNNFLKCPWQYFFVNLLQIPKAQENPQLYGSAIHGALHDYFEAYKREEDMPIERAADLFESYLRRTHMSERDLKSHIEDGRKEIVAYLSGRAFPRAIWNEYAIPGVPFAVEGATGATGAKGPVEIMLNGKLDKVELLDGSGSLVNVVDYKTGKPKSRNAIEGKTKDADGDYKRQLVFYKLILDRYKSGEWRMKTGTIDFIKPDEGGKLHREAFEISDDEVKELETLIAETARKIISFDLTGCDKPDCEWCALRKQIEG